MVKFGWEWLLWPADDVVVAVAAVVEAEVVDDDAVKLNCLAIFCKAEAVLLSGDPDDLVAGSLAFLEVAEVPLCLFAVWLKADRDDGDDEWYSPLFLPLPLPVLPNPLALPFPMLFDLENNFNIILYLLLLQ